MILYWFKAFDWYDLLSTYNVKNILCSDWARLIKKLNGKTTVNLYKLIQCTCKDSETEIQVNIHVSVKAPKNKQVSFIEEWIAASLNCWMCFQHQKKWNLTTPHKRKLFSVKRYTHFKIWSTYLYIHVRTRKQVLNLL